MPSFWDMVNFYRIHLLLFAKEGFFPNILGFYIFFLESTFLYLLRLIQKKCFWQQIDSKIAAKWTQKCFLFHIGQKSHFTKILRKCCLFYITRGFRIHIDSCIWVKNKLKKCLAANFLRDLSRSKKPEFLCFFMVPISDHSILNQNYWIIAWPIKNLYKSYLSEHN